MTPLTCRVDYKNLNFWIDEAIWGHRFYNDQTPWLVLLEFLCLFESRMRKSSALQECGVSSNLHEKFSYDVPNQRFLREVIFRNPLLSDFDKWDDWIDYFSDKSIVDKDALEILRKKLHFRQFVSLVEMLSDTSVEAYTNRRWNSKFVFPYGPNCLYHESSKDFKQAPDRRFFARSGEMLYLMMNRSEHHEILRTEIETTLFKRDTNWDRIVKEFSVDDGLASPNLDIGYLPFASLPRYDVIAEDWIRILRLNLSRHAKLDPLMRISALHLLIYILERSHSVIGKGSKANFIVEIATPTRTSIFELSKVNFNDNQTLTLRALECCIDQLRKSTEWNEINSKANPRSAAIEILKDKFKWTIRHDDSKIKGANTPDEVLNKFVEIVLKRHKQHLAKVHRTWSSNIGLITAKRGIGTWYSPNDSLLKALVMSVVVEKRMNFDEFLSDLFGRYGFVIGINEAEKSFEESGLPTDSNYFRQNANRLEERLKTLGVLERLSDDCAYVINPFFRK